MSDFQEAIQVLLAHEGGYVNNPLDPGGETNYGISKRSYPNLDIKNITKAQAIDIYYQDWWQKYGYSNIQNQSLATKVFDLAVNTGPTTAHKLLQQSLNHCGADIIVDGILGPETFAAINTIPIAWLLDNFRITIVNYYLNLCYQRRANEEFLLGWMTRAIS